MSKDFFTHKADGYEQNKSRVDNVENIANSIIGGIGFKRNMHVMDFGSGTGLLLERIAPLVEKITAVDISNCFDRDVIAGMAKGAGFRDVIVTTTSIVDKPQGNFPVFLLRAYR